MVKKIKNKSSKKKYLKIKSKIILVLIGFFTILFLLFLGLILSANFNFNVKKTTTEIPDVCSIISGNLMHEIETDAICKIRCDNFCEVSNLIFLDYHFIKNEGECNSCSCTCKEKFGFFN